MSLPSHVPEDHANSHAGVLQVAGGLILPRRMLDRPWLDSRARQAALAALDDSPLSNNPAWRMQPWSNGEARATYLRYYTSNAEPGGYPVRGEAGLNLSGRRLSMALGFQWLKKDRRGITLSPEHGSSTWECGTSKTGSPPWSVRRSRRYPASRKPSCLTCLVPGSP